MQKSIETEKPLEYSMLMKGMSEIGEKRKQY
jgi:hypothetical protein